MALRQIIVARYKEGATVSSLSRDFKLSRSTVYTFIKRASSLGESSLEPHYCNCGRPRRDGGDFIYRAVRCMRNWHPSWGSQKIRAEILRLRPELSLPHYRTFTRWFHWNNQIELRPQSILPKSIPKQAQQIHEGWQIDAKEEMELADGSKNCWLNITDEYSSTVIDPIVFPL